jgi:hypothetical protein
LRFFLVSPVRATYPTQFRLHDLVIQVGFNAEGGNSVLNISKYVTDYTLL